jgi:hypothetical protein
MQISATLGNVKLGFSKQNTNVIAKRDGCNNNPTTLFIESYYYFLTPRYIEPIHSVGGKVNQLLGC